MKQRPQNPKTPCCFVNINFEINDMHCNSLEYNSSLRVLCKVLNVFFLPTKFPLFDKLYGVNPWVP